jgi:hypothetical protein
MRKFLLTFWPRAEVLRLRHENERLSVALRNATDTAADRLIRLEELRDQKCPACEILKQTLNFHVLAAGSKVGVFDGVGPTLPPPVPHPTPEPVSGPMRASKFARQQRQNYMADFLAQEARVPVMDDAPDQAESAG